MRFTVFALAIALTACGPSLTPEQRAQRAEGLARVDAALANAQTTMVGGKTFRVGVFEDRSSALVDLVSAPMPYFVPEVEAAARQVTQCTARFQPGILAIVGGDINTADLSDLRDKFSGRFNGWGVRFSC